MDRKKLIYAFIAFLVSFTITYFVIKSLKKKSDQNAIENIQTK